MNKLTVSTKEESSESFAHISLNFKEKERTITKDTIITDLKLSDDFNLTVTIMDGVTVLFGDILTIENIKGKLTWKSGNDTHLEFHLGLKVKGKNDFSICHELNGNQNYSDIKLRIINEQDSSLNLKATGMIAKNTMGNEYAEDIKYLNEYPGSINCLPELLVDSDDVVANHNMTVGNISEEVLFYLGVRGIAREKAQNTMRECFINSMKRKEDENAY